MALRSSEWMRAMAKFCRPGLPYRPNRNYRRSRANICREHREPPGKIYVINPEATPGPMTVFEEDIGISPLQITFDGTNLWTANTAPPVSAQYLEST